MVRNAAARDQVRFRSAGVRNTPATTQTIKTLENVGIMYTQSWKAGIWSNQDKTSSWETTLHVCKIKIKSTTWTWTVALIQYCFLWIPVWSHFLKNMTFFECFVLFPVSAEQVVRELLVLVSRLPYPRLFIWQFLSLGEIHDLVYLVLTSSTVHCSCFFLMPQLCISHDMFY